MMLEANKELDQVKIIDFGTAVKFEDGIKLTHDIGTPYYIAPQVLDKSYTAKCDVWSIGVITYMLLSGQVPFNGVDNK